MKKIFIVLAFIFVGMANAMQLRLLDGNEVRQYVHTDPEEIAYLKSIQDIQQEDVQSRIEQEIKSKGRTAGPGIEQIFSFLVPVQNHNDSHIKPLILGFLQKAFVENVEEHREECNEKSISKKRTFEEAALSDERNKDVPEESVVSNVSKKAARKSSTSKNMDICGINGCQYRAAKDETMNIHKGTLHEQKQCPYPGCTFHRQSRGELSQHVDMYHPEKYCTICGYTPKRRCDLLRHLQFTDHSKDLFCKYKYCKEKLLNITDLRQHYAKYHK